MDINHQVLKKAIRPLLVFILLLSIAQTANANLIKGSKKDSILLTGLIFNNDERVKHVNVKIYNENSLIKTIAVRASNRFKTYIPPNSLLTIEITAPDFHEKRFIFDTHLPEGLKKMPSYEFDIDVYSEKELEGVNPSFLDFPAGIVKYSEKKNKFLRDKNYTKRMKKEYFNLLKEAAMSERGLIEDHKK